MATKPSWFGAKSCTLPLTVALLPLLLTVMVQLPAWLAYTRPSGAPKLHTVRLLLA